MKIAAIIAEYNPFHQGHAYHIEETRRITGCDYVIVVMSGNFVQRGAPAIIDKYKRTESALKGGADLVIELPACYATASAELFAFGAVSLIHKLGCVNYLSFGCESDITHLSEIADILSQEPSIYKERLQQELKEGVSFPAARANALSQILKQPTDRLAGANNILAVEYLKALQKLKSVIIPIGIKRLGHGYHDMETRQGIYPSATGIRHKLLTDSNRKEKLYIKEDDFSTLLHFQLIVHKKDFFNYASTNRDLCNRMENQLEAFTSWSEFCSLLKSKNQTYTAISRFLTHILIGYDSTLELQAKNGACYARILGLKKTAGKLLSLIAAQSELPIISKLSDGYHQLNESSLALLNLDLQAADIYKSILTEMDHSARVNEFRQSLIYI